MTETLCHRHTILCATMLVVLLAMVDGIGADGISAHTSDARRGLFEFPVIALGSAGGQVALEATHTEETSPALDTLIQWGRNAIVNHDWQWVLSLALSGLRCDSTSLQCHYLAAIAGREIGSGFVGQNVHWKMAQGHFEWILHRDSTFEDALVQYALLERNQGNRVRALELAQLQMAITPDNEAAQIGLFRLLRHFLIAESFTEFLSWSKGYSGASFRFFEGEAMRRAGSVSSGDSVLTSLLGVMDGIPQEVVRTARARLCFMRGNYANAESEYMMAVQGRSSDVGAEVLFDDIKYIISDAELDWYRSLHILASKQECFRSLWRFRNPLPASKSNPRLLEHIRRYLVAEERYEYAGPRTRFSDPDTLHELAFPKAYALNEEFNDLGLVYLHQGVPDDIARHSYSPTDDEDVKERIANIIDWYPPKPKPFDHREKELFAAEVRDRYRRSEKEDFESWLYDPTGDSPTGDILGAWKQVLRVEDFSKPGLTMSSVQLLRRSPQRGALEFDGVKVIQCPFVTQLLNEPFYVYFQIYDLIPDGDGTISYATECRLIRAGDHGWDEGIPIHTKVKVGKERNVSEFYTIDLERTKPGSTH